MNEFKLYWLICMLLLPVFTQAVGKVDDKFVPLKFAVLADHGYDINQVSKLNLFKFITTDSLIGANIYWLRIVTGNQDRVNKSYYLRVTPDKNTKFYFFDRAAKKWLSMTTGARTNNNPYMFGVYPYEVLPLTRDTTYMRVDVSGPNVVHSRFKVTVSLKPKITVDNLNQKIKTLWLIAIVVLMLFLINNIYIYFSFKDKAVIFYLMIQLGVMFYLTAYWYFFETYYTHVFNSTLANTYHFYDINQIGAHIGIMLVLYGYVQLTRSYLNIKKTLALEDQLLRYCLNIYLIASIINIIVNVCGMPLEYYTIPYDNVYCAILIALILYTCVKAYILKVAFAVPYLLANLVPLTILLTIPIYHLLVSFSNEHNYVLPFFGVIAQALGFSIALVTRTRSIQDALMESQIQSGQLAFDLKEADYLNKLNELKIQQINAEMCLEKERSELLKERLELNQRELASSTLNMVQKSELLALLKDQLQQLNWLDRYHTKKNVHDMTALLEDNIELDSDWKKFKIHFEQVHPDFFENLKRSHPALTAKEIRLYTYFEMKLNHKEIAALLNIDPASVRRAKTRLLKKMRLPSQADQMEID
ncbi:hypothetical protein [Mucilaginibacter sp. dw_454]|uniref:hypothetical protein n=1 Tax=Mucilaginibacter sp. dw_454 TaxID=2720079 RepID=UPI001BD33513|nr:hypothetical protein [Mucilaginibacter sp. dw_454]